MRPRKLNQNREVSELLFSLAAIFVTTAFGVLLLLLAFWIL